MMNTKNLTDKLKTLAVGATLMAGIALGTGCDDAQKITPAPSEDVVNDNDENNDGKPVDNNDTDNAIENNDKDDVIGDNDKDEQPIEKEDKDDKEDSDDAIDDNDDKDNSDVNDNDPIENNDNDNNPSENDDSDYTGELNVFFRDSMIATKQHLENLTQDEIDVRKETAHNRAKNNCPYDYIQQPEQYDTAGNMHIVDKCQWDISEPMWLENAAPKILQNLYGVPPPTEHRTVSVTTDYSNTGSQSNMKIKVYDNLMLDVNFVSKSCLSQVKEDTSVIEMFPNLQGGVSTRCEINGENETLSTVVKNTKPTRSLPSTYVSLCKSMPNYQLDEHDNACYTTIEEFVWLESVTHKLLPIQSNGFLPIYSFGVKSIKRDLDTDTFYMTMQIGEGSETSEPMYVYITLKNAKSCIDQCHGKEGCTSHIEPSQNASRGCIINGEEIKGEESAQRLQMRQHNLKQKTAPRFIKPAPAVAKQHYAKNIRLNRQKWLAQNVRNFGRNGR